MQLLPHPVRHRIAAFEIDGRRSPAARFSYRADMAAWRFDGVPVTPGRGGAVPSARQRGLREMKTAGLIEVPEAPVPPPPDSWLYVIELGDDLVKVGRSRTPAERLEEHRSMAIAHGHTPGRSWVSDRPVGTPANEAELLRFCAARASGRRRGEYFAGLSFDLVLNGARVLQAAIPEPEPLPEAPTIDADGFTTARLTAAGAAALADARERERLRAALSQIRPER